ncbi:MAG TPA: c-type cytochrome [Candidatus Binataceae bacterium]|nr:c-type cytochrome [Candidatus Binataceae bacterium]
MKSLIVRLSILTFVAFVFALGAFQARAEDLAAAKDNYRTLCVKCHGASGRGDGPAASTLATKPGDLTDCARMARVTDDVVFKVIKEGGPAADLSPKMAGYADGLDDTEIKGLVGYVRSFCQK